MEVGADPMQDLAGSDRREVVVAQGRRGRVPRPLGRDRPQRAVIDEEPAHAAGQLRELLAGVVQPRERG